MNLARSFKAGTEERVFGSSSRQRRVTHPTVADATKSEGRGIPALKGWAKLNRRSATRRSTKGRGSRGQRSFALESVNPSELQQTTSMTGILSSAARLVFTRPRRALLLLRMSAWIAIFSLAVKVFSLPRALRLVSVSPAARDVASTDQQQDLVSATDALLGLELLCFKPICWKRAAILHRYLGLNGINTTINFGLRKGTAGPLSGHAWLETDGQPVFETELPDYAVTYVFPSSAPFAMDLNSIANRHSPLSLR